MKERFKFIQFYKRIRRYFNHVFPKWQLKIEIKIKIEIKTKIEIEVGIEIEIGIEKRKFKLKSN